MQCLEVREHFPAYVDQPAGLPAGPAARAISAHLRSCPGCQADLDAYRRLGAALATLPEHPVEPPAWLLGSVISTVRAERARHGITHGIAHRVRTRVPESLTKPRVAVAGGAVLLAGVAAGALLLRSRSRRGGGLHPGPVTA